MFKLPRHQLSTQLCILRCHLMSRAGVFSSSKPHFQKEQLSGLTPPTARVSVTVSFETTLWLEADTCIGLSLENLGKHPKCLWKLRVSKGQGGISCGAWCALSLQSWHWPLCVSLASVTQSAPALLGCQREPVGR